MDESRSSFLREELVPASMAYCVPPGCELFKPRFRVDVGRGAVISTEGCCDTYKSAAHSLSSSLLRRSERMETSSAFSWPYSYAKPPPLIRMPGPLTLSRLSAKSRQLLEAVYKKKVGLLFATTKTNSTYLAPMSWRPPAPVSVV